MSSSSTTTKKGLSGLRKRMSVSRKNKNSSNRNDNSSSSSLNTDALDDVADNDDVSAVTATTNDQPTKMPSKQREALEKEETTSAKSSKDSTTKQRSSTANGVKEKSRGRTSSSATDRGRSSNTESRGRSTAASASSKNGTNESSAKSGNVFQRLRERSRSRSRSAAAAARMREAAAVDGNTSTVISKELLAAVTSCRSDGYYKQRAPGSTSKLPRKAPTNLKLFHELAVGVKDAYEMVGATPTKPAEPDSNSTAETSDDDDATKSAASKGTYSNQMILYDFVGNLDFLLALVDEVSTDTVTRGALKDDPTFKSVRDVIKKGNRVLEEMLVRRERKYTLFFRLVQQHDYDQIERIKAWNHKVDKAVRSVTSGGSRESYVSNASSGGDDSSSADGTNSESASIGSTSTGSVSSRVGVFSRNRGRDRHLTSGRSVRRATPTPRMRKHRAEKAVAAASSIADGEGGAAVDGFSASVNAPFQTKGDMSSTTSDRSGNVVEMLPNELAYGQNGGSQLRQLQPIEPKDELVDVIRGLRVEKQKSRETQQVDDELAALKPSWRPKAEIPSTVPKLPTEYVHRHRLMKQVVSCLLDETEVGKNDEGIEINTAITCVTSRHGDKAGNGKSTLAVAVIQTVEVRERFSDGIAWLKLGRGPLTERDVRRLYEELYRQLIAKEVNIDDATLTEDQSESQSHSNFDSINSGRSAVSEARVDRIVERADGNRRFQGGDLEGIKEDLARMIVKRNILICLDDVWRVEDVKWFIFETPSYSVPPRESPYKILITTRIPGLLGNGTVQEVFVRILSEHEAVKLLLSTAGRRPYGGRTSAVFNQSKMIVKGCGNSPLGILLVGSMLRQSSRNWNINSPVWTGVFNQCSLNLEEAAQMRSFKNAFTRIVDMSLFTIDDPFHRVALRRCFVLFAMAFRQNDWMLSGRGIPQSVLLKFFETVITNGPGGKDVEVLPEKLLEILEHLKLIQRARHSVSPITVRNARAPSSDSTSETSNTDKGGADQSEKSDTEWDDLEDIPKRRVQQFYTMHDSLKAVAEKMSERTLPCFTPGEDQFTFYTEKINEEEKVVSKDTPYWPSTLRFLFQTKPDPEAASELLTDEQVHQLVATSLVGGGNDKALKKSTISEAMRANHLSMQEIDGGNKFEEYAVAFLPEHLMSAQAHSSAAEILCDSDFVCRRVFALGIMESTSRQVADILDLRSHAGKGGNAKKMGENSETKTDSKEEGKDTGNPIGFDIEETICDASKIVVDEVYKVTNSMGSSDSLGMATCLATVGECLLKCRQPRDSMLRLEEAVSIYRGLLGPYHVYVAHALHSVAKALTKLGETRVSLLKFAEAARIYETCDATLHYDSIANAQSLASLLVDIGDIRKAEAMFEEVIAMKQTVYGETSVPVAKTINNYAILLAKHGRMKDALKHYDIARQTYMKSPPSLIVDPEFEIKCSYDVTLITLNIASIYSKKGDFDQALECYEEGVQGLEEYEEEMTRIREINGTIEVPTSKSSSHKHLVAALGRIGSIKVKKGDHEGALEAYMMLIKEVDDASPLTSHVEKAKAHIKCATIFRKRGGSDNHATAVTHLREALRMYKALYDPGHKDTTAIATTLKQWLAEDKVK